jgi:hypothetical protein
MGLGLIGELPHLPVAHLIAIGVAPEPIGGESDDVVQESELKPTVPRREADLRGDDDETVCAVVRVTGHGGNIKVEGSPQQIGVGPMDVIQRTVPILEVNIVINARHGGAGKHGIPGKPIGFRILRPHHRSPGPEDAGSRKKKETGDEKG